MLNQKLIQVFMIKVMLLHQAKRKKHSNKYKKFRRKSFSNHNVVILFV